MAATLCFICGPPALVDEMGFADSILVNGKIVSMDDAGLNTNIGNVYEAMSIKGHRIQALGTNLRIRAMADSNTKMVDLKGRLIIPGIIETHAHLFGTSQMADQLGLRTPDKGIKVTVMAGRDIETTRMRIEDGIRDAVKKVQPGDWVVVGVAPNSQGGAAARDQLINWIVGEDLEPRSRLDRVAADNPVLVQGGIRGNLNSRAWELVTKFMPAYTDYLRQSLGGDEYADAPERGLVGSQEMGAIQWEIWFRTQPRSLIAELFRRHLQMVAANGVTTFSSRVPHPVVLDGFILLNNEGQLPIRFAALYEVHRKPVNPEMTREFYKMSGNLTGFGNDNMWIHGVASERWDTDFPMACLGPDVEAAPEVKKREVCPKPGEMWWDTLQNALEAGWRLAGIHGEGSHGVRLFIQMVERAMKNTGMTVEDIRKMRLTVEHAPVIGKVPDVVEGLRKYGIIVSASPAYFPRSPAFLTDYGSKIEPWFLPIKSLLDQGVKVVGQETTGRTGYLWTLFMTRKLDDGTVLGADEAIDRVTVLKMWTRWAADYVLREKELGSLEVGKFADFVVLDKDYFTIPIAEIPKIRPQMTVMGADVKYLSPEFARELSSEPIGYQFSPGFNPWDRQTASGGGM